jgi:hypothetical protein
MHKPSPQHSKQAAAMIYNYVHDTSPHTNKATNHLVAKANVKTPQIPIHHSCRLTAKIKSTKRKSKPVWLDAHSRGKELLVMSHHNNNHL